MIAGVEDLGLDSIEVGELVQPLKVWVVQSGDLGATSVISLCANNILGEHMQTLHHGHAEMPSAGQYPPSRIMSKSRDLKVQILRTLSRVSKLKEEKHVNKTR